ncbi:MAG: histidine ammonia-lyase [Gemmatimonadetes bacterium 13_2_20CM_69_8]|nr:MAG: histidine ammonia-lyase [Gemmatimonadetes bacterium 13_2_20CM_69_8]OLD95757.1 MAG: histidine ammonia-lyase [Gemmatimonadetes bacterium 13_1_20CM_4_69_16]PYO13400.1 MAG: histidine ammonia-lyase [Gemmatimonadota bacterium]
MSQTIQLDGRSLSIEDVVAVARRSAAVTIARHALDAVRRSRRTVEDAVARGVAMYGVTTGFGKLAHVRIPPERARQLQLNLIRSHASGVGDPLSVEAVRAMMLLRANVLVRGTSGVRPELPELIVAMLNHRVHPRVPSQGSVGASGDLAPLAHLALAMIGEGEDGSGLRAEGLRPIVLEAKEGLAFVNGTQAQTGLASLVVHDAWVLWRSAHAAAAMSLEATRGTPDPFDPRIHDARPHPFQQRSAALLRELLADSRIRDSHRENDPRVQDAYSIRCSPQVLGAVGEGIAFAERLVAVELNAATDNPLVFDADVLSGGNFHGQPIALALDVLGIALATLAGLAERRLERIVNPDLSSGLPAFLARDPGVESGFMTAQIVAAALVADCRVLATPASVQSVPTEGNQEDVVPMGMSAAWKAERILANATRIVAIELLAAAQGLEFLKPLTPGRGVARAYGAVRGEVSALAGDRPLTADIERIAGGVREGKFDPEAWQDREP